MLDFLPIIFKKLSLKCLFLLFTIDSSLNKATYVHQHDIFKYKFFTRMRNHYPQVTRIDLYIGGELLSPVDDKRLIGKCNLPERVVSYSKERFRLIRYYFSTDVIIILLFKNILKR